MLTIRKKLVLLFAAVLAGGLGTLATALILSERAQITASITENSVHFAELSGERIAELYDTYYRSQSYALFDSELSRILARNPAIERVDLATAEGKLLFASDQKPEQKLEPITDEALLARLKVNKISIASSDRVVYLTNLRHAAAYRSEDPESREVEGLEKGAQVGTIILPLSDESRRVIYHVSYAEVAERVASSIGYLALLFLFGFAGSLIIATRFSSTITAPLAQLRLGAHQIAKGDLDTQIQVESNDETRELADTFNQMTTELKSAMHSKIAHERVTKELEVANEIQTSTLPRSVQIGGLDITVAFRPASEVGGDVYDVIPLPEGRTVFYLGDATGHGVPAGLVAALTSAVMATAASTSADLGELLQRANTIIHAKTKPNMFITLLAWSWDSVRKKLHYSSAGHEQALIYRAATGKVEQTERGTLGLGMLPKLVPAPREHELALHAGDLVLLCTDGITEAVNLSGSEQYGSERLERAFAQAAKNAKSTKEVEEAVLTDLQNFCQGAEQLDDITLFVIGLGK